MENERFNVYTNMTPLVSVLMTSYNREKYIGAAIESVLASTYQQFELVIVDDGSKDKTVEIARNYVERDQRVKLYVNERNLGDYPNRNKAASYASGKYIKYVDADDLIYPLGLQLLVETMEKYPQAGWGLCSLLQNRERPYPIVLSPEEAYRYHYFGPGLFHKAPLSSIIRKDVFDELGGFTKDRMVSDTLMWHRLARFSPVVLMQDGVVWYREHGEQELTHVRKFDFEYEKIITDAVNNQKCPLTERERKIVIREHKKKMFKKLLKSIAKWDIGQVKVNYKSIQYSRKPNVENI